MESLSEFKDKGSEVKKDGYLNKEYANINAENLSDTKEYVGYETLNFNTLKPDRGSDKIVSELQSIMTKLRRLKIMCFAQLVLLLMTIIAFGVVIAIAKPHDSGIQVSIGEWSIWSSWTLCTASCGKGLTHRYRNCRNNHQPSSLAICQEKQENSSQQTSICEVTPCSLKSAFTVFGPKNGPILGSLNFINISTNVGYHFNQTTGKYICEFPGLYFFSLNLYKYPAKFDYVECYIRKNGIIQMKVFSNPDTASDVGNYEATGSVVLPLLQGDVVDLGACTSVSAMDYWTSFTGFLLSAD